MAETEKKLTVQQIAKVAVPSLKRNGIKKAGLFGSYALGEAKKKSDIDMLVQPAKGMGFKFAGLEIELSEKLHKKVDLVSYGGLSPYLKEKILGQEVRIL